MKERGERERVRERVNAEKGGGKEGEREGREERESTLYPIKEVKTHCHVVAQTSGRQVWSTKYNKRVPQEQQPL